MRKKLRTLRSLAAIMAFPERHSTTATADRWKKAYETKGEQGLINSKPCPENPKLRTPKATEDIIIHLRTTYHLGQKRIIRTADAVVSIKIS